MHGASADADGLDELVPPGDPETIARVICLRLLERRARSRAELATALRAKGVPDEAANRVLDRFGEVGLIDDDALAGTYALAQHRERGLAGRAVETKLRQRGIDEDTVRAAVEQIDTGSELDAARTLVAKRLRLLGGLDRATQARRLIGLLARKGYPPALAHQVVRDALSGLADPPVDGAAVADRAVADPAFNDASFDDPESAPDD